MQDVFKECFNKYFQKLHSYAFTIVGDNAEAKDIVQHAFIKLWEKRSEINMDNSVASYLYTTVYHLALNSIRNKKTRETRMADATVATTQVFTNSAEQKEISSRISSSINNLPERCREVFHKSRIDGRKYSEIAAEMGISIKTVEAQMGKALKFLREDLADVQFVLFLTQFYILS